MNLVWIASIVIALAISVGIFVLGCGAVLFFFRRQRWWLKAILIASIPAILCFLWSAWLGPREITDPNELTARFELVFGFTPESSLSVDHYQLATGPDDMAEWFSLRADIKDLDRLSPDLTSITSEQFGEVNSLTPDWWRITPHERFTHYAGSIPGRDNRGPSYRELRIAYDRSQRRAYCYIHSLL